MYLFTKIDGKVGLYAHLTIDGKQPICSSQVAPGGEFVFMPDQVPIAICGKCHDLQHGPQDHVNQAHESEYDN